MTSRLKMFFMFTINYHLKLYPVLKPKLSEHASVAECKKMIPKGQSKYKEES